MGNRINIMEVQLDRLAYMLRSEAAPPACMGISELDGFLTGVAVSPRTIPEAEWLPVVLGAPGRVTATSRSALELVTAIRNHFRQLVDILRDRPEDLQPVLLKGPHGTTIASAWCEGFMMAVHLRLDAWDALMQDGEQGLLLMPILSLCRDSEGQSLAELEAGGNKGLLNQLFGMLPAAVEAIHGYWRGHVGNVGALVPVTTVRKAPLPGRNDPCFCGSGKKYKRCCDGKPSVPANVLAAESGLALHRAGPPDAENESTGEVSIPAPMVRTAPATGLAPNPVSGPAPDPVSGPRWVQPGEAFSIQGIRITRGMVYVGSAPRAAVSSLVRSLAIGGLKTAGELAKESIEPSMIDPSLFVRPWKPGKPDQLPYDLSYRALSPLQRGRYLRWLANGAKDAIDTGYFNLYFHGLERRLLVDTIDCPADAAAPLAELDRIASLYGGGWQYLKSRFANLKEFLRFRGSPRELPAVEPDFDAAEAGMPTLAFRYALGMYARDRRPLPSDWALWLALNDDQIPKPIALGRCREVFAKAFAGVYKELYGEGLLLPRNKARLTATYYANSPALRGRLFRHQWDDLPDVLAASGPRKKLTAIVQCAAEQIEAYSRLIGRYPERAGSMQAYLTLPASCWPDSLQEAVRSLRAGTVQGLEPLSLQQLMQRLALPAEASALPTAGMTAAFAKALEGLAIGFEPDVLSVARKLAPANAIVLFPLSSRKQPRRDSPEYRKAATSVALLCRLLESDENASAPGEVETRIVAVPGWEGLPADLRMRLRAQYALQRRQPVRISSLKKQVAEFAAEERAELARMLSVAAHSGGAPSLARVRTLEQIYGALQLDERLVYTHLHSAGERSAESGAGGGEHGVAALDPARIARLQRETEAVSALLANVFADEALPAPAPSAPAPPAAESPLPGLDQAHAEFAARLLTRPRWQREELEGIAAELRLMLDGALERINDVSLDETGEMLLEGDDLIDVNLELLEGIAG